VRAGSEHFICKDFPFYDSMVMPVLGLQAIAVYEVLRRHIWRARDRGAPKVREAFRAGKLAATIGRTKVAELTGLSVKQVGREMNTLRRIGWVRSANGFRKGEALLYQLGERQTGYPEHFYADGDLRELWLTLEALAEERGLERVTELPCAVRREVAQGWFDGVGTVSPKGRDCESQPPSEGRDCESLRMGEPSGGEEKEKAENRDRASANDSTGPQPKALEAGARKSGSKNKGRPSGTRMGSAQTDADRERGGAEFAIDEEPEDRFAAAAEAEQAGRAKSDKQVAADVRRAQARNKGKRSKQVAATQQNEQRARNLKGGQAPPNIYREAKRLWGVLQGLLEEVDSDFPRTAWNAKANVKARGQMSQLVEMYGGEPTELTLTYMVRNWELITERYFKNGSRGFPNLGALFALHESLYREAVVWGKHSAVLQEWDDWQKANPNDFYPPDGLKVRYQKARESLKGLGFGS
jgi:hypothetical protein